MNKYERVMAAYLGQRPDRVPSAFWYHFPKGFEAGQAAVDIHLKYFAESGTDLCKIMNENSCPKDPAINDAQDWSRLAPIPEDVPFICRQLDLTRSVMVRMKGKAVTLGTVHGIVASAYHILGGTELYDRDGTVLGRHLRENPEGLRHAFRIIADYLKYLCRAMLDAGVDGIYFASLGGERRMFTDDEFATFIAPLEIEILDSIQDAPCFNILHMCKSDLNLERYLRYPDPAVLNWGVYENNLSLEEGRRLFGANRVYLGGLDDRKGVLPEGTAEEIGREVRRLVDTFGYERYILGADCTLPTDLPAWRTQAAARAATIG